MKGVKKIYITIKHDIPSYTSNNFRTFTEAEFTKKVETIANSLSISMSEIPCIFIDDLDSIASCQLVKLKDNNYYFSHLNFHSRVLNGKDFTHDQIEEIIKHELAHIVATLRHNDDCDHDSRWKEVAKEFGCSPNPNLCKNGIETTLNFSINNDPNTDHKFYLYCSNCGSLCSATDDFDDSFQWFLISIAEVLFGLGKSDCCSSHFTYEANVSEMLKGLKSHDLLPQIQNYLEEIVTGHIEL